MDAVTYPTPEVIQALSDRFVCHTVNTAKPGKEGGQLLRTYRLLWEPGIVFTDPRGTEIRRVVGYRSPRDFLAELALALGLTDLLYAKNASAVDHFTDAVAHAPETETAPEALYWKGIAVFRRDGRDKEALKREWDELARLHPRSRWWRAADVLDCEPTGVRQGTKPTVATHDLGMSPPSDDRRNA